MVADKDLQKKARNYPQIDGYKVSQEIKIAGLKSERVFRGVQLSLDREVMIRTLNKRLTENKDVLKKFVHESLAIAKLKHANIIGGIDAGNTPKGIYYFVLEYIKGDSLFERMKAQGTLSVYQSLEISQQIASALEYVYEKGFKQRDIHPENIIISSDNVAKLANLRLNKQTKSLCQDKLLQAYYMSPEVFISSKTVDLRSDMYSLGIALFHMVTGALPFKYTTLPEIKKAHLSEPPIHPQQLRKDIPDVVCHIIGKCLAKNPEQRYQTYSSFIKDTSRFLKHLEIEKIKEKKKEERKKRKKEEDIFDGFVTTLPRLDPVEIANSTLSKTQENFRFETKMPELTTATRRNTVVSVPTQKTYSWFVYLLLILFVFLFAGAAAVASFWYWKNYYLSSPEKKSTHNNSEFVSQEEETMSLARRELESLENRVYDFLSREKVSQLQEDYKSLLQRYKNHPIQSKIAISFINFKNVCQDHAEKEYRERRETLQSYLEKWKSNQNPYFLRQGCDVLSDFPEGLFWTSQAKRLQKEREELEAKIISAYKKDKKKAFLLKKKGAYREALHLLDNVLSYILETEKEEVQNFYNEVDGMYKKVRQQAKDKYGEAFREEMDQALWDKDTPRLTATIKKYEEYGDFRDFVEREKSRLRVLDSLEHFLYPKNVLNYLADKELTSEDLSRWSQGNSPHRDWTLCVYHIREGKWKEAKKYLPFLDEEDSFHYEKIVQKNLDSRDIQLSWGQVKKLLSEGKLKLAWEMFIGMEKRFSTEELEEKLSDYFPLRKKVQRNYLHHYAVFLYFNHPFSYFESKSGDFRISYKNFSENSLGDFWGTTTTYLEEEWSEKGIIAAPPKKKVFEVYWKGVVNGDIIFSAFLEPEEKIVNQGISIYKQGNSLDQLEKYLVLLGFHPKALIATEIYEKTSDPAHFLKRISRGSVPDHQVALVHLEGKAPNLPFRENELGKKQAEMNLGQDKKYLLKLSARKRTVFVSISSEKKKVELSLNQAKYTSGFVGFYSNTRVRFSQVTIEGRLDSLWLKQVKKIVEENPEVYLKKKLKLPKGID